MKRTTQPTTTLEETPHTQNIFNDCKVEYHYYSTTFSKLPQQEPATTQPSSPKKNLWKKVGEDIVVKVLVEGIIRGISTLLKNFF